MSTLVCAWACAHQDDTITHDCDATTGADASVRAVEACGEHVADAVAAPVSTPPTFAPALVDTRVDLSTWIARDPASASTTYGPSAGPPLSHAPIVLRI